MGALLGLIFHTIGGVAAGSFYMPYKKVKGWSWESYWIIGGIFSWFFVPALVAYLTVPAFFEIIGETDNNVKWATFFMGILWGIGGLTYGLGIRYLGMSLGNSIVLGCCSAFGALVPSIYYDFYRIEGKTSFLDMLASTGGRVVLLGILLCLLGIVILGKAGLLKESELERDKNIGKTEFNIQKGLIVAVISGVLSAFFNFGIEAGEPMTHLVVRRGYNSLFQNNVTFVVILWGGLTTNFLWCLYLNIKNKSIGEYVDGSLPIASNILFSAMAGTIWYFQFFFMEWEKAN